MSESSKVLSAAEHLVGNLWYNLDAVAVVASKLQPNTLRSVVGGPPAVAYSEMCRLLRSPSDQLSAASLEANLKHQGFDFDWLGDLQARIAPEDLGVLLHYAAEVNNAAKLRHIRGYCAEADKAAQEHDAQADEVAAALLGKLTDTQAAATDVEHISAATSRVRNQLESIKAGTFQWGAKTGFAALDKVIRMVDGDLIVVGGRPSQGKSSLARQIFLHRAKELQDAGDPGQVVMFTADDTGEKTVMAMASIEAQVDLKRIRNNQADKEEWQRLENALARIEGLPIYIDDTSNPTVEQMYYRCAMLNASKPVRLAAMDYLELVSAPKAQSDLQKVEAAARGVKGIGSTLGFPFMLLSQLSKGVEERRDKWPTASDLRYAGEAEADVVVLVMRPEHYIAKGEEIDCDPAYREGVALLNVSKNKTGDVGLVPLAFKKEYSRFYDLERHYL